MSAVSVVIFKPYNSQSNRNELNYSVLKISRNKQEYVMEKGEF